MEMMMQGQEPVASDPASAATPKPDERKLKIALVCSHGGHLTEMQTLSSAFAGYDCILITYRCSRTEELSLWPRKYLLNNIGTSLLRMIRALAQAINILFRERPDVVLSTGAEIAIPFLWVGRFLGARTVYVESWCRVRTRSGTGPLVYPAVDLFLVQWPEMVRQYGQKARYLGGLI
jgi:UDP-N-acetylglucosamine:LPS N-acetylglucosamine transferase